MDSKRQKSFEEDKNANVSSLMRIKFSSSISLRIEEGPVVNVIMLLVSLKKGKQRYQMKKKKCSAPITTTTKLHELYFELFP